MRRMGTLTLAALIGLLGLAPGLVLWRAIGGLSASITPGTIFLLAAAITATASALALRRHFLATFSHEMSHMVLALLTSGRVHEFRATDDAGGFVRHSGPFHFLIGIAPYSIPLLALSTCLACWLIHERPTLSWTAAIGAAWGFHVGRVWEDSRNNLRVGWQQTDFRYGLGVVFAWGSALNLYMLGAVFHFARYGGRGVGIFSRLVGRALVEGGGWVWRLLT